MKLTRLIVSALVAVLALTATHAQTIKILGTSTPGSSCTNANVLLWGRLEDAAFTTGDYPTSGLTMTFNGGSPLPALDTTQAKLGTNGLKVPGSSGRYASLPVSADNIVSDVAGRMEFWFRYKTGAWNANGNRIVTIFGDSSDMIRIQTLPTASCSGSATGCIELTYRGSGSNTTVGTTSSVLTADTWHRIALAWDRSQGTDLDILSLSVDNTIVAQATGSARNLNAWTLTSATAIHFGDYIGGIQFSDETYYDQVIVSTDPNKDLYSCRNETVYVP